MQTPKIPGKAGPIDIESMIAAIKVPPGKQDLYDKAVLTGLRIMFDKDTHKMTLDQMEKEGELWIKIVQGVGGLLDMLYQNSNGTLDPELFGALVVTFALRAFEFAQMIGDKDATKETLGEALDGVLDMLLPADKYEEEMKKTKAPPQPTAPPGMLSQGVN